MTRAKELLSEITFLRTYSKVKDDGTKETWDEVVERYISFLKGAITPAAHPLLESCIPYLKDKKVVGSMRLFQFAGEAVERENARAYNCSFTTIESFQDAAEVLFLSACGVGVGYSIQRRHILNCPPIGLANPHESFFVQDSRESWADSIPALLKNPEIQFDYSTIRPAGALLSTGGFASGPEPLKLCHERIREVIKAKSNQQLSSFDWHIVITSIGDAIVSGGVRRTALIALFDIDDEAMLKSKSGDWWAKYPQFGRANNSAVFNRAVNTEEQFKATIEACFASNAGEPGLSLTNNNDWGYNPCVTGDTKIITKKGEVAICDVIDKPLSIWNGYEWSTVTPRVTGVKAPILKVTLNTGKQINVTHHHKFLVKVGKNTEEVLAKHLKVGDVLERTDLPVITSGMPLKNMYMQGFYIADGDAKNSLLRVYHTKFMCLKRLGYRLKPQQKNNKFVRIKTKDNIHKFALPINGDVPSRLDWLAGYFDGDGCALKGRGISLDSTVEEYLLGAQSVLISLGVTARVYQSKPSRIQYLKNNHGGISAYACAPVYTLYLKLPDLAHLLDLGLKCERLKFNAKPKNKPKMNTKVVDIQAEGVADKVYCFDEPKRHTGVFNGILTGQCHEIALKNKQFCNLTDINLSAVSDYADFIRCIQVATILGTIQSSLSQFSYLSPKWKENAEQDRLLGVSLTGQAQNWSLLEDPAKLKQAAQQAEIMNRSLSEFLGINRAARITTVKPSGTTSVVLGTSSGIHAVHAPFYIRRVGIDKASPLGEALFKQIGNTPYLTDCSYNKQLYLLCLPIKMEGINRNTETAIELLERMKHISSNWIEPGHITGDNKHNVSLTVSYNEEEKDSIVNWMWSNKEHFNGISLLPNYGGTYQDCPYEEISEEKYKILLDNLPPVNLKGIVYTQKDDERNNESACAGGLCELPSKGN